MKWASCITVYSLLGVMFSSSAQALPFSDNITNEVYSGVDNGIPTAQMKWPNHADVPDIRDAINHILGTSYPTNAAIDPLFVHNDSLWMNLSGKGTVIGYSIAYYDRLGYYGGDGQTLVSNFYTGTEYKDENFSFTPTSSTFGWFIEVENRRDPDNIKARTYYSESHKNRDGYDHMMAFDLSRALTGADSLQYNGLTYTNPYLITWEDQGPRDGGLSLGDDDYNDIIFLVDAQPKPVPEPVTMVLFGSGLVTMASLGRKWNRRK